MKKRIASLLLALTLLCSAFSLSSCYLMQLDASNSQNNSNSENKNNGGSTINLNGGDSYNVNINSSASNDVLAASKALLSAVSVYCNFERVQYGGYYGTGSTTTASSAGAGVIYKIDKTTGDAYVITNYHVVYDAYAKTTNHISDDITVYLYDSEGAPLGMQYHGANYAANVWDVFWYERNIFVDIVAIYDEAGTLLATYTYDAY